MVRALPTSIHSPTVLGTEDMSTEAVQTYRSVLVYQDTECACDDDLSRRSYHCQVGGHRLDAQTMEALQRRIDQRIGPAA